jgi:hypothetical protein
VTSRRGRTIGSALFVGVFTIDGYFRPGYDQFREYVSALSIGPRGWIQIANFVVVGLLLLESARGISVEWQYRCWLFAFALRFHREARGPSPVPHSDRLKGCTDDLST